MQNKISELSTRRKLRGSALTIADSFKEFDLPESSFKFIGGAEEHNYTAQRGVYLYDL